MYELSLGLGITIKYDEQIVDYQSSNSLNFNK